MNQSKKVFVKVNEFPTHNLQLLLSLPPHEQYTGSHDAAYNCNLLVMRNNEGFTRVYSMGMDIYTASDLKSIFTWNS